MREYPQHERTCKPRPHRTNVLGQCLCTDPYNWSSNTWDDSLRQLFLGLNLQVDEVREKTAKCSQHPISTALVQVTATIRSVH